MYGWTIDHTYPLNPDDENINVGADIVENMQPMSIMANHQKANNLDGIIRYRIGNQKYKLEYSVEDSFLFKRKCRARVGILKISAIYVDGKKINDYEYHINDGYIYRGLPYYPREKIQFSVLDEAADDGKTNWIDDWSDINRDNFGNIENRNEWDYNPNE